MYPLCQSTRNRTLFPAKDLLFGTPGDYKIARCLDCQLRYTTPLPEDLESVYPEEYGPHADVEIRPIGRLLKKIFEMRSTLVPDLPKGARVLEIGCGAGGFLSSIKDRGWERHGLEPVPAAADLARKSGAAIFEGTLQKNDWPDGHFDAIFAWMAIEHLPRLGDDLLEIGRLLKPGGWLGFSVPNADSWEFSFFQDKWYDLQVPIHVSHFGKRELDHALGTAGLKRIRLDHQRNILSIIGSLGLLWKNRSIIAYPDRPSRIGQALLYPFACVLAAFRQGGRVTGLARKGNE
jgi:SAM-dependent methyltransferase